MNQHRPIDAIMRVQLSDMVPVVFRNSVLQIKWGIVVFGVILLGGTFYLSRLGNAASALLWLMAFTLGLPALLLLASYFTARSTLKNNPSYRGEIQYSFSDEGIYVQGIHSKGNLSWNSLHHVIETRHAFLLFHDKYNTQVLPKRCFASDSDLAALRALMQVHVPNTRRKET